MPSQLLMHFSCRLGEQAAQVHSTKVKSNTQNPLFQEILTFDLLQADLVDARLVVDVWNKDCISKDDFLGEAILELFKEEVNGGVAVWYKLKQKVAKIKEWFYFVRNTSYLIPLW